MKEKADKVFEENKGKKKVEKKEELIRELKGYFEDKNEIYLNSPITTSPDMSQGFLFYKEKLVMPVYIESKKEPYLFDIDVEMIIG